MTAPIAFAILRTASGLRPSFASAPPDAYLCPITKQLMIDPVCTADGHTFERAAIERWLAQRHTSPLTGLRLPSAQLTPNLLMRSLLRELEAASK